MENNKAYHDMRVRVPLSSYEKIVELSLNPKYRGNTSQIVREAVEAYLSGMENK